MIRNGKRILLKQKIYKYLNNEINIDELENCESFVTDNQNESKLLNSVFHAIQHFDADFDGLNDEEKANVRLKLKNIADTLVENDESINEAISVFFNDPYS